MFFGRGTFWDTPAHLLLYPQQSQGVPFPRSVNIPYFCSGPMCADPICPRRRSEPEHPGFDVGGSVYNIYTNIYIYIYIYV